MTKIAQPQSQSFTVIQSLDDIPDFGTEAEEAEYWDTHTLHEDLWHPASRDELGLPPIATPMGLNLSLSAEIAKRLRCLAKKKGVDYVTLTQRFVAERLYEEEKREGIIGDAKVS